MHDDVIDAADTRRGRPTANAMFDNAASVMLGDYMFANAAELVSRTGRVDVIRLFAQTLMTMAKGELNQDISAYDTASGNVSDYYQRIHGKTASLFATAGAAGAIMASCDEGTVEALRRYGRDLGMAFQIVDDILDFSGDGAQMGKPVGGDLIAGTLTLPSILLLEQEPEGNPVSRLFATDDPDERRRHLDEALERIGKSDILERSMLTAREWSESALEALIRAGAERASGGAGRGGPVRDAARLLGAQPSRPAAGRCDPPCFSCRAFLCRAFSCRAVASLRMARCRRCSSRLTRRVAILRSNWSLRSCLAGGRLSSACLSWGCSWGLARLGR